MRRLSAVLVFMLTGSFAACAARDSAAPMSPASQAPAAGASAPDAAAPPRESKASEATATPTPQEEADPVVALAEAEGALDRALAASRRVEQEGKPGAPKKEEPLAGGGDACAVACRALASMRRSAERLCGLATGAPAEAMRCDDARTRVTRAEGRVKQRCPACPATD